jgi:hypothetical protein
MWHAVLVGKLYPQTNGRILWTIWKVEIHFNLETITIDLENWSRHTLELVKSFALQPAN